MGSLISMFEQARPGDPVKRPSPRRSPVRAPVDSTESIPEEPMSYLQETPTAKPKPKPNSRGLVTKANKTPEAGTEAKDASSNHHPSCDSHPLISVAGSPETQPQTKITGETAPAHTTPASRNKQAKRPAKERRPTEDTNCYAERSAPQLTRPMSTPLGKRPTTADTVSSDDTFVSASSVQSPVRASPPSLPPAPPPKSQVTRSTPSSPTRDIRRHHPKSSSVTNLPLESLTSAIVAGSLASSRLTPHNTGGSLAPPVPRRQKSPRLMQTLRQPAKESDEELDRHKKKALHKLHSGKHSHHEGSRKKWREEITPRERKRYEAVWASNRGVLLEYPNSPFDVMDNDPSEYVLNVVVRQIWKRSRLPADELGEVWDLVDRKGRGILGRQEFVVGMWLIDQRLRGRKIPAKVSDSVWGSANGMKVIKPRVK
ncbi:hypothetical protein NM208_g16980 [Fusarium decemcellulare]|uniref:Uncharacterized protein n=1 Tax=Fusarium decemcellulare TaxID=57161 RepID=A0ACC1RA17_9HYPO|nr:hypothetical protein NM208_g16980 [Fusarium decemcellulare]